MPKDFWDVVGTEDEAVKEYQSRTPEEQQKIDALVEMKIHEGFVKHLQRQRIGTPRREKTYKN